MSESPVIFITGATSGFGRASVARFAREGWKVIATGRRRERLEALEAEFPGKVAGLQMDLTDTSSIHAAIEAIPAAFRPVRALFNNGGLALGTRPVPDIDTAQWRTMIETNIVGLYETTLALLPELRAVGRGASIINTGSIARRFAYPGGNVYGATKAFVHQFSMNLRTDLAGTGIRVTMLEPGHARTEFTTVRTGGDEAANEALYADNEPLLAEDIAEAAFWIATLPAHVNINLMEIMPVCQVPQRPMILSRDQLP